MRIYLSKAGDWLPILVSDELYAFSAATDKASLLAKDERLNDVVRSDAADAIQALKNLVAHFQESQDALMALADDEDLPF